MILVNVALLINRRDYDGLTNVILFLYFLRNERSLDEGRQEEAR